MHFELFARFSQGEVPSEPETSEAERRRIGSEFERLRRLLDEKERAVLQRLAELDAAFEAAQAEKASRVAEEIGRLHGLIGQLEAGRLPQDTGSSLSTWNEARLQLPPELEKSLRSCRRQHAALEEALKESRDPGRPKPKLGTGKTLSTEEKAKGTPDPGSAPPQVLADRKSVRWDEEQDKAREPQRCEEEAPGALGCEGAAPRRCSWEVEDEAQISGL
ncbi:tripartite motif-containing protein 15-like isoform X3 [Cygnus atratus]|uniref:tripartite motif-containing protein 15-like isoform X3 n=1 Tax=Cygnus atratus TaxID=8868 RepID=UPI0021B7E96F|nr:tripartite motif-containing protein 15-like isoform X3 [Cygnus atratus]